MEWVFTCRHCYHRGLVVISVLPQHSLYSSLFLCEEVSSTYHHHVHHVLLTLSFVTCFLKICYQQQNIATLKSWRVKWKQKKLGRCR